MAVTACCLKVSNILVNVTKTYVVGDDYQRHRWQCTTSLVSFLKLYLLWLDIAFSHHVYFQQPGNLKTQKTSCVMKNRQAYKIFRSHIQEESQKSYFKELNIDFVLWKTVWWVFLCIEQNNINVNFQNIFWELIQWNIFPHLFSLIEVLTQLWHSIWNILSYKKFASLYTLCKLSYHCATSRKVPGSIPGSVTVNFFCGTPDRTMCPEVHSTSESEYQGFSLW